MKNSLYLLPACYFLLIAIQVHGQDLKAYLVHNKCDYQEIKDYEFDPLQAKELLEHSRLSDTIQSDMKLADKFRCVLIYFNNSESTAISSRLINADSIAIHLPDTSIILPAGKLEKKGKSGYHATIVPFALIGRKFLNKEITVTIEIKFTDKPSQNFVLLYGGFPSNSDLQTWKYRFNNNRSNTVDSWAHRLFESTWNPMYVALYPVYDYKDYEQSDRIDELPLEPEEGANGFLIGGNFSMPFSIIRGRDDQGRFWRTSGVYVNSEFSWRIANKTESSPLVPLNTKAGIGTYRTFILNKPYRYKKCDPVKQLEFEQNKPLRTIALDLQVMHYSNGQDSSVFRYNEDSTIRRTDFESGNFSTNYLKGGVIYNSLRKDLSQLSVGGYYRYDLPLPGFAEYEKDQQRSYGRHRFELFALYKLPVFRSLWPFRVNKHHSLGFGNIFIPGLVHHSLRLDLEILIDDVSEYALNGPDRPVSMRLRYENQRLANRSAGFFLQYYLGRDDLNIRYNLWTSYLMAGVTFRYPRPSDNEKMRSKKLEEVHRYYENYPCKRWWLPCFKN